MNVVTTLLWLEIKRTAWVLYAALVGVVLFVPMLLSLPGVMTGLDLLAIPTASDKPSGRTTVEMTKDESGGTSSFSWSFSKIWGAAPAEHVPEQDTVPTQPDGTSAPDIVHVPVPESLQFAFRPRQFATAATAIALSSLMLLGFWVAYGREADRGEMVMLYQSPISGHTQLALRLLYMSLTTGAVLVLVIAIYWIAQKSQSHAPFSPLVEALGNRMDIHWGNLVLATLLTQILPNAAFILLFVQMQNAYDLLGGQRLAGIVLILASLCFYLIAFDPGESNLGQVDTVLRIVSVESNDSLANLVDDFDPSRYRIETSISSIALGAGLTALMLGLSGWVWREVEWS